jgi:hypothetical protein
MPYFHELEKAWCISRVIVFACSRPADVFRLSLVGFFWRQCMLEYKYGKDMLDRTLDARCEWQSDHDVVLVWQQAAAILKVERVGKFEPELVTELVAAIRRENTRAGIEFDEAAMAPRDRDDERHPEFRSAFVRHPAAAVHRFTQSLGSIAVAFRDAGLRSTFDWFHDDREPHVESDRSQWFETQDAPGPRVCQGAAQSRFRDGGAWCSVTRSSQGFLVYFCFIKQRNLDYLRRETGVRHIDVSMLPSTLRAFSMRGTKIASGFLDFGMLALACPRLRILSVGGCGLRMNINVSSILRQFPEMESLWVLDTAVH